MPNISMPVETAGVLGNAALMPNLRGSPQRACGMYRERPLRVEDPAYAVFQGRIPKACRYGAKPVSMHSAISLTKGS
jgi:hypothetical protein